MLGKVRVHGRWEHERVYSHANLIPGSARAVLVWVGIAVAPGFT